MLKRKLLPMLLACALLISLFASCTSSPPASASPSNTTSPTPSSSEPTPTLPDDVTYGEAPMLADKVASGELPSVEERLPEEPMVLNVESIGTYGGELVTRGNGPGDWGEIWHATFPHLVWLDQTASEFVPDLAKGFEFNEDQTELTLYLREGLKWSDGDPFDADDLECWWKDYRMHPDINPTLEPPTSWAPGGVAMEVIKVDQYTITYKFAVPYPNALNVLASWEGMAGRFYLPSHLVRAVHPDYVDGADAKAEELYGEYDKHTWVDAVGMFANLMWPGGDPNYILPTLGMWRQSESTTTYVLFERNPYYWAVDQAGNQLPYIDTVKMEIVTDDEVAAINVMQGKYSYGKVKSDKLELTKASEADGNYNVRLYLGDTASYPVLAFNQNHKDPVKRAVFQDVRFRQAMSVAINRDELNDLIFDGYGRPTQATVNVTASFYKPEWSTSYAQFDPDLANSLLDEMGLDKRNSDGWRLRSDGKVLEIIMTANTKDAELIRGYWRNVGVKVEINSIDTALYSERAADGELDIGWWGLDNTVEFKVFQSTSKFYMGSQDLAWAVDWTKWYTTNGAEGEEPPENIKEYLNNWRAMASATGDEYTRLANEIFDFYARELYLIGTVGYGLNAVFVNNDLQNVPQEILLMDPTNFWLLARPDTWYFK